MTDRTAEYAFPFVLSLSKGQAIWGPVLSLPKECTPKPEFIPALPLEGRAGQGVRDDPPPYVLPKSLLS